MATTAQMRELALAMPEVEEKSHFAQPDFRVRGKIFAGLSRDGGRGTLKLTPEIQATVVEDGGPFFPCPGAWGRSGWTYVELKSASVSVLRELVNEAWRVVAPKKLIASLDEGVPLPTSKPAKPAKTSSNKKSVKPNVKAKANVKTIKTKKKTSKRSR